jgi:molybdenum cofactor guanylyltransferase
VSLENSKLSLSGLILAGGKSRRIGFNKLKIRIGKVPLLIDLAFKLKFLCDDIIISTSRRNLPIINSQVSKIPQYMEEYRTENGDPAFPVLSGHDIRVVLDDEGNKSIGPLMGLHKGLRASLSQWVVAAAFDMPFISHRLLYFLVTRKNPYQEGPGLSAQKKPSLVKSCNMDARIFKTEKGFEALCALYSKDCIRAIEENMEKKIFKISDFFDQVHIDLLGNKLMDEHLIDQLNFFNINDASDCRSFEDLWEKTSKEKNGFFKTWSSLFFRS